MSTEDPGERRARSVGALVFALLVSIPTLVWATEVIVQAFSSPDPHGLDCRAGLSELITALDSAQKSASPHANELEALAAFRASLGTVWEDPRVVRAACADNPELSSFYGRIERLRYAEEHAVRYATRGLAADRNAVGELRTQLEK
jgi:hypothetical protein